MQLRLLSARKVEDLDISYESDVEGNGGVSVLKFRPNTSYVWCINKACCTVRNVFISCLTWLRSCTQALARLPTLMDARTPTAQSKLHLAVCCSNNEWHSITGAFLMLQTAVHQTLMHQQSQGAHLQTVNNVVQLHVCWLGAEFNST